MHLVGCFIRRWSGGTGEVASRFTHFVRSLDLNVFSVKHNGYSKGPKYLKLLGICFIGYCSQKLKTKLLIDIPAAFTFAA
jgi:hypothetical protein